MNKILKSFGVFAFGFYFTNLFSMQAQSQADFGKLAQQKLVETKLEEMINLLKEVKDVKDFNSVTAKTTGTLGTVLRETLLIGGSLFLGFVAALAFQQKIYYTTQEESNNNINREAECILVGSGLTLSVYALAKLFLLITNKLSEKDPLDKETKEKLDKVERLLEQVKFTQELKSSGINQQLQNPVAA